MAALALLVLLVPGVGPAQAQDTPDAEALGLEVTMGFGGWIAPNAWTPVEVRLQPEQPFRGRILLAATGDGSNQVFTRDVEVGAEVTKAYHLLAPPSGSWQVQVVADGADEGVTVRPDANPVSGFLVGVLGDLDLRAIPGVTSPTTDQQATVAPIPDEVLGLGPRALDAVSTLVVDHGDLLALPEADRDTVAQTVAEGTHLVVTGTTSADLGLPWQTAVSVTGDEIDRAPGAWGTSAAALADGTASSQATADLAAIAAGRGRVVTATWQPERFRQAAVWEHVLQPTGAAQLSPEENFQRTDDLEQVFRATAGTPLALGWLAAFLVGYLVLVGPVLAAVFRRRRHPELAWIAVPVVTALFATAAFFGATGARPRVGVAGHVATWVDGVGTTLAVAGVRAPQPGQHTIALPNGPWDVVGSGWNARARVGDAGAGGDTTVQLDLDGFSFGAVIGLRPATTPAPLEVEVALFESEAHVEVTNVGTHDLDDVELRLATDTFAIADHLAVGQTVVETLPLVAELPRQGNPFGNRFDMPGGPQADTDPAVLGHLVRWSLLDGSPGLVWVTATTPGTLGLPRPSVDGSTPQDRGTLVAVGTRPSTTDDMTSPFEVQRDVLFTSGQGFRERPLTVSGAGPLPMRFHLPHEGAVTRVDLLLDRAAGGGLPGGVEPRPAEPVPLPEPVDRCGLLETRDGETGDLVSSEDLCGFDLPCPPEAVSCAASSSSDGSMEGEVCFQDGQCHVQTWHVEPGVDVQDRVQVEPPIQRDLPIGAGGMQVWDHQARRWEDAVEAQQTTDEVQRWLSPLGDVWVRATGELVPLDLAPQGVGAQLGGSA